MNPFVNNLQRGWTMWTDARVPMAARAALLFALSYFLWPYDLIPDNIPYFGYVDDFCVTVIGVLIFRLLVPADVIDDYWREKRDASGLSRHAGTITRSETSKRHQIVDGDKRTTFIFMGIFLIILMLAYKAAYSSVNWPEVMDWIKAIGYVVTVE
jgi:uncharacterized membrane protein YkvA (DUF1232 family)